jgi:hypothetical protein
MFFRPRVQSVCVFGCVWVLTSVRFVIDNMDGCIYMHHTLTPRPTPPHTPQQYTKHPTKHQYIYGPLTNKRDYLDWFFDRLARDRPLPLPLHGDQLTTLTHVEDVAALLGSVVDNPKAVNQVFNCATDRWVFLNLKNESCGWEFGGRGGGGCYGRGCVCEMHNMENAHT